MPEPSFIAENSRFFENLLEHRFIYDLGRHLVLQEPPRLLNVMRSEVDAFGFDLALSVKDITRYVQMKTRSGKDPTNPYAISDALWSLPEACVIWLRYNQVTIEPVSYHMLGDPLPDLDKFRCSKKRRGFRSVRMSQANHRNLDLPALAELLFGSRST
jgi:hypothetical protein